MKKNNYATRDDIKELENVIKELQKGIQEYVLQSEVRVLGELQKLRDDFDAHQYSHVRINDDLVDHDKRLKNLEAI